MDPLTESEKTFFECFAFAAKRPYLGYIAGAALFFVGMTLYSRGARNGQTGIILFGGFFFGLSLFEIIESYLAYRLLGIIEKMEVHGGVPGRPSERE